MNAKVIPHHNAWTKARANARKRYEVQYYSTGNGWSVQESYRLLWLAKYNARLLESFGYFKYRVVDTGG